RAREEAERRAREEAEAARLKAQQEAEAARLKAEREIAKAREEAELARRQAAAEAKAREDAEQRAKAEAEAARLKAEQEAARVRAELEAEKAKARAEAEAKAREEAERRAREEAEVARLKAQQEAEAARLKAEREIAKAREEAELARRQAAAEAKAREDAERRAKAEAEAARLKAEQEAARARAELKAEKAKARAEAEARAREEAERRAREEAEAARLKAQQEAGAARSKAESEALRPKPEAVPGTRSSSATVLFLDVVGYTRQPVNKQIKLKKQFNQLLSDCLSIQGSGAHIILDTGDGAAIGFLQHPEDALEVAMRFRKTVLANQHNDYPDMKVRTGIHLGPVNVVRDVNGKDNMVGDGINDAQRVMSFAEADQIYISRSYYDFISRLNDEYAGLFEYRGSKKDKHGREHPVYELVDGVLQVAETMLPHTGEMPAIKLEPFSFVMTEEAAPPAPMPEAQVMQQESVVTDEVGRMEPASQIVVPEPVAQPLLPSEMPPEKTATPSSEGKATPAEKAHMPSEEEVEKVAREQARVWAEAERRASEAAKTGAERAAKKLAEDRERKAESKKPAAGINLSRLPWGKIGVALFVVALAALFVVPYVLPTQDYANRIERQLAARLQQPAHIGHLSGRLLPFPRLELEDVSIGAAKQFQAKQVQVNFTLPALFAPVKPISSVNLEGLQISGTVLQQAPVWLQKIAADAQYPVAHIELHQGRLEADDVQLSGIGGELNFDQAGRFTQAKLHAEGGKLTLGINAAPENKIKVSFAARAAALPLLPNWHFDDLNANGELTGDELVITDFDGHILGGMLRGNMHIGWRSGWRAEGTLSARTLSAQGLSKALSGDLDGSARARMEAESLGKLIGAASIDGSFAINKGLINGIDIIETARQRSRQSLPGGRTRFDELSGEFSVTNGAYAFRQLKLKAGVLNATGKLDAVKQQLSGNINAGLTMRAGLESIDLQVGGTVDSPSLRAVR
ncbi:MAG: AsmA family protein, partial [Gallionellaceae bacterium]|nr:AsmA family protein [Gallionellaceae bacterium]